MLFLLQPAQMEPPDIDRLIDAYAKPLLRLCYLYLRDYHHAEEAVQDTLYRAYVKYGSFNGQCSEATWITRIAINACKDIARKWKRGETSLSEDRFLNCASPEQSTALYREETSFDLLAAVYALPDAYRIPVLLCYYEDLPVKEAARLLRLTPNTLSVRLKRARALLRTQLEEADARP